MIEHLAQLLKLVFRLLGRLHAFLSVQHALECFEISAVFHETRDIDLRANVIAEVSSRVEQRSGHEEIHEGGAVAAVVEKDFAVFFTCNYHFFEALYTASIRLRALEEAAVAANSVIDTILGCAVEF